MSITWSQIHLEYRGLRFIVTDSPGRRFTITVQDPHGEFREQLLILKESAYSPQGYKTCQEMINPDLERLCQRLSDLFKANQMYRIESAVNNDDNGSGDDDVRVSDEASRLFREIDVKSEAIMRDFFERARQEPSVTAEPLKDLNSSIPL